jgi:hypothetical protein
MDGAHEPEHAGQPYDCPGVFRTTCRAAHSVRIRYFPQNIFRTPLWRGPPCLPLL